MIICPLGAEFHADRHDEANSRSSQFLRTRLKISLRGTCDIAYADVMNSLALYYRKLLKQVKQVLSAFILYSVRKYFVHRAVFENFHKFM